MELRPVGKGDLASLAEWLRGTAAELGCARWASEDEIAEVRDRNRLLIAEKGVPEGFVDYQVGTPQRDAARIRLLAVRSDRRRLGIGSRAVLAVEERLRRTAARCFVLVPAKLGLAFYFWLRLGYRPLNQREWPTSPEEREAVWMVRPLA